MTKEKESHKLPSLDGWRAVSIALVLAAHSTYATGFPAALKPALTKWFDAGAVGVGFFFVISGFLITYLLIQEQARNGAVDLKKFYIRRALRILPIYGVYLVVLGCFTHYTQSGAAWAANLTFTTNFFWSPFPTAHLWSLGVEEQFYLIWPWFVFFLLCCSRDAKKLLHVLLAVIVAAPIIRVMACKHWYPNGWEALFNTGSFFVHFDTLAYGCAGAVLFKYWREMMERFYAKHFLMTAVVALVLVFVPTAIKLLHLPARVEALLADSAQALGFTLLLVQSILYPVRGFYRALNWNWMRHLGILSYSIYIWQQMFPGTAMTVFGRADAWWTNFPWWILAVLVVAHASYYLMERPLLGLRAKFRSAPVEAVVPADSKFNHG